MEIQNIQKNIHTSPRKLRLVADLVRKMGPVQAVNALQFVNKAAAKSLGAAIKTAIASAKQQKLTEEKLVFKKLEINEGLKIKRVRPQARGRRNLYTKKMSHIKVVLEEKGDK